MLLGAHDAGIAIEASMLGATHACANPLTATYGTTHGVAIAVMLPHVVRWNAEVGRGSLRGAAARDGISAASAVEELAQGRRPAANASASSARPRDDIPALAADAATQWTGTHNPGRSLISMRGACINQRCSF